VVLFHIPVIGFGHFGVDIFFVISGFVMMLSTEMTADKFFLKRIVRIVPTYWFFTIGVFLIALILPDVLKNTTANPVHLIKSFFFVPFDKNGVGVTPILALGWTLNYEMYFYLLFAIALKLNRNYRGELATFMLVAVYALTQNTHTLPLSFYSSDIVFEFSLGIVAFHIQPI